MSVLKHEGTHPIRFETASVPVRTVTHTVYRAIPDLRGEWPTVMVIGGAKGLSSPVRDLCRRLARHGFAALAPDLYAGVSVGDDSEEVALAFANLEVSATKRILRDVGRYLADGLGPWDTDDEGFGIVAIQAGALHGVETAIEFGSPLVLAAPNLREISPGMDDQFKPLPAPQGVLDRLPGLVEPLLGLSGRADEVSPIDDVMAARDVAPHSQWVLYEGADHDFLDDNEEGFDLAAFGDAFDRIVEFFGKNL